MNNWGTHREVEKPKLTRIERHQQLRFDVASEMVRLGKLDEALQATVGHNNPIRDELRAVAKLFDRLTAELCAPKP